MQSYMWAMWNQSRSNIMRQSKALGITDMKERKNFVRSSMGFDLVQWKFKKMEGIEAKDLT